MRSDCQTRCTPLYLAPASYTRDATFDYARITLGIQSRIVSIPNYLFRFLKRPLKHWIGNGGTFVVRFVGDGIEEVEVSNSNSRIKFPYNFLRSRTFFDRRINLFLFLSFFFIVVTLWSIKEPIGNVPKQTRKTVLDIWIYRNRLIIVVRKDCLQRDIKPLESYVEFTPLHLSSYRKLFAAVQKQYHYRKSNENTERSYHSYMHHRDPLSRILVSRYFHRSVIGPAITMEKLHRVWRCGQRGRESGSPSRWSATFQLKPPRPSCRHDRS